MAEDYDLAKVAADIHLGRHDGNLEPIFDALRHRMADQLIGLVWWIDLGEVGTFELSDMTGNALEAAEHAMGKSVHALNPEASITEWKALVAAWLLNDCGWDERAIGDLVQGYNMDDIVASVHWREASPHPFDTSASGSTPTKPNQGPARNPRQGWWRFGRT